MADSEQQVNASSSLAQAPVVALALLAFSASAVVTVTPPERPARPPAPVAAPDALPIAPHPSRGGWRTPLVVPRAAPDARHGQWPANWTALANCESSGNPAAVDPSGHYFGLFQFDLATWASVGGRGNPARATRLEQLMRAQVLYRARGRSPWPVCGRFL